MNPTHIDCQEFHELVLAALGVAAEHALVALDRDAIIELHAADCAPCAQWRDRATRAASCLRGLARSPAPRELDGRVVAALGGGARQQRAVEMIARLGRLHTPPELDGIVGASARSARVSRGGRHAPEVLERLVVEELADPAKARVRRFVGSLRRMRAPDELAARVHALAMRSRSPRPNRIIAAVGLAAAILGIVSVPLLLTRPKQRDQRYPFRVERVDAAAIGEAAGFDALRDPMVRRLIDGASGGMLSAHSI